MDRPNSSRAAPVALFRGLGGRREGRRTVHWKAIKSLRFWHLQFAKQSRYDQSNWQVKRRKSYAILLRVPNLKLSVTCGSG